MNFAGLMPPYSEYKGARFVVIPVPYEMTSTYGKGSIAGPNAIIEASNYLELYDEEINSVPAEAGIATLNPIHPLTGAEDMISQVTSVTESVMADNKIPVLLGGEHTISYAGVKAASMKFARFSVLQFDAHADLRDVYLGSKYNHACTMARIREITDAVQVGIRSLSYEESGIVNELRKNDRLFFAKDVAGGARLERIIEHLDDNVYITFDLDAFDPSIMSSTGTPEPGGLIWDDTLRILKSVCTSRNIIGFDLMELAPQPGRHDCDFTAAKLAYKMMAYINRRLDR